MEWCTRNVLNKQIFEGLQLFIALFFPLQLKTVFLLMIPDGWKWVGCSSPSTHPHADHLWGGCPARRGGPCVCTVLLFPVAWLVHGPRWTWGAEHRLPGDLASLPAFSLFSVDQGWPETSHFFSCCAPQLWLAEKKNLHSFFFFNC